MVGDRTAADQAHIDMVGFVPGDQDVRVERAGWVYYVRVVKQTESLTGRGLDPNGSLIGLAILTVVEVVHSRIRRGLSWKVGVVRLPAASSWNTGRARAVHRETLAAGVDPDRRVAELVADVRAGSYDPDRRLRRLGPLRQVRQVRQVRQGRDHAVGGPALPRAVRERELTESVQLTLPDGRLNPEAVGWTRTPLIDTDGVGRGRRGRGRNKRWEYWAVTTPTHVAAMVVSDIDYAAVHGIWLLDRRTGDAVAHDAIGVLGGSATLPGTLGAGPARSRTRQVEIDIDEVTGGTRLRARGRRVELDVVAHRPEGHESLGVVVPWTDRLFQYTVKDVARPATGTIRVDGVAVDLPAGESWATLDHGRGRWPYAVRWNWGAGSGRTDGRVVGIQVGGQWTDGTGSVENSLLVDGHLTKISEELVWDYDQDDWMAPWRVTGESVDLTLTPFHLKKSVTDLKVFASRTHQCFGHWSGRVRDDTGTWVRVADVVGWAEDVRNRW